MRILLLNYEYPPLGGGAANATKHILREFGEDVHVDLVTSSLEGFKIEKVSSNVTVHFLDIGKKGSIHYQSQKDLLTYAWKAYWYSRKLRKSKTFDLCHAFFGIPCGFIAMCLGLPYIVSLRGSDVPGYNERFKWLDILVFSWLSRIIWSRAKFVIANSRGLADLARKTAPNQPIGLIYNGVDTDFFTPGSYEIHKPLRVLTVGRLIPRKNISALINACAGLDVSLTIVGEGPEMKSLQSLVKSLNVKAHFVGKKDHTKLVAIYQSHDVFCLPSVNEGMSNTVLEAMACGMPIVANDVGGIRELVSDNGIITSDFHVALQKDFRGMGRKSREKALKMSWTSVAKKYEQLYVK